MHQTLPPEMHEVAVEHLKTYITEDTAEEIRALYKANPDKWWAMHHMFMGMQVRNLLRQVIKDEELPPVQYGDQVHSNWDDYYIPVLEYAAGCYED